MKNNFSIQDWKSNHFYKLIEEVVDEAMSMKTKTVPNPNAGKWRIVSTDNSKVLSGEFFDSEAEAKAVASKMGQLTVPGYKIVQLPPTKKVYTAESNSHVPSSTSTTSVQDMNMGPDGKPAMGGLREDNDEPVYDTAQQLDLNKAVSALKLSNLSVDDVCDYIRRNWESL